VNAFPSETFETVDRLQYRSLHPQVTATCSTCSDVTCACPAGVDIPGGLVRAHGFIRAEHAAGRTSRTPDELAATPPRGDVGAKIVRLDVVLQAGAIFVGRFWIENAGPHTWKGAPLHHASERFLLTVVDHERRPLGSARLRHDVPPGTRTHVVVEWRPPADTPPVRVLLGGPSDDGVPGTGAAEWSLSCDAVGHRVG
jgi:hypothetical protein